MKLQLNDNLIFDSLLPLEMQEVEVQEYIAQAAYSQRNVDTALSEWEGTGEPGQPIRYTKLVHNLPTLEGPIVRTTVSYTYRYEYGHPASFAAIAITLTLEVQNG